MTESRTARDDEVPPAINEVVAEVVRMYGYDAVRDELAKQAVATTARSFYIERQDSPTRSGPTSAPTLRSG